MPLRLQMSVSESVATFHVAIPNVATAIQSHAACRTSGPDLASQWKVEPPHFWDEVWGEFARGDGCPASPGSLQTGLLKKKGNEGYDRRKTTTSSESRAAQED
eukprot:931872-Rhodomonas_salina.3